MTEQENNGDLYVLPSGDVARLARPDLYTILSQMGAIPDPITTKVLKLLELDGITLPDNAPSTFRLIADKHLGMYGIYSWCRVDKRLDLSIAHGDGETTLGRVDVLPIDLEYVYYNFFRAGNARKFVNGESLSTSNTNGFQSTTSDLHDVPDPAEPVFTN